MIDSKLLYPQFDLIKLAENICEIIFSKYSVESLMEFVRKNKTKDIFIEVSRKNPKDAKLIVDTEGKLKYSFSEPLMIPIPKKFAILEPDKYYFEMTLRANVFLAVFRANEKELHK